MKSLTIIICGGRNFNNYSLLESFVYNVLSPYLEENYKIIIRSGNANGADILGERFAKENNFELQIYKAEWNLLGKGAGFLRNEQMALGISPDRPADICIAFWDGISKGTKHMINLMKDKNKLVFIRKY